MQCKLNDFFYFNTEAGKGLLHKMDPKGTVPFTMHIMYEVEWSDMVGG
jgi:hypothetical protein